MKLSNPFAGAAATVGEHVVAISLVSVFELGHHMFVERFGPDFRAWPALVYVAVALAVYGTGFISAQFLRRRQPQARQDVPAHLPCEAEMSKAGAQGSRSVVPYLIAAASLLALVTVTSGSGARGRRKP